MTILGESALNSPRRRASPGGLFAAGRVLQLCRGAAEGSARAVVFLIIAAAFVVNLAQGDVPTSIVAGCTGAAWLAFAYMLSRQTDGPLWNPLGLGLLGLVSAASVAWAVAYSSPQIGDHGVYWRCGTHFQLPIATWLDHCRGTYLPSANVYGQRALVYTVPIARLFANSYLALKLVNAGLHILTAATLWQVTARAVGARGGFLALMLLATQPEWWFTLTLAAGENLGLFLIVAVLWLIGRRRSSRATALVEALALAMLIVAADWSRSIGMPLVVAALLFLAIRIGTVGWTRAAIRVLAAAILYACLNAALSRFLSLPQGPGMLMVLGAFDVTIRPPQNFTVWFEWAQHLWPAIEPMQRGSITLARFVDEFVQHFQGWVPYMAQKAALLFEGTGTLYFAAVDWPSNVDNVYTVARNTAPSGPLVEGVCRVAALAPLPLIGLSVLRCRLSGVGLAAVAYMAVLLFALVSFFEVLTRYQLMAAPALAIVGAHLAIGRAGRDRSDESMRPLVMASIGVAILGIAYDAGALATGILAKRSPRTLGDIKQDGPATFSGTACNGLGVPVWAYYGRIILTELAPGVDCASFSIPVDSATRKISFFITRETLPFPDVHLPRLAFQYAVRAGDATPVWEDLGRSTARWHELRTPLGSAGKKRLQVIVRRTKPGVAIRLQIRDLLQFH